MTSTDPTPILGPGLVVRRIVVPRKDVVYVRGIFEASDGVAAVYSVAGGDLTIAATPSRSDEVDQILSDLEQELGKIILTSLDVSQNSCVR